MTYPFSSPNSYGGRGNVSVQFRPDRFPGPSRVILVAVNSEILPPIFHQETVLQRMRVVSVPPDQPDDLEPADLVPGVFKRPLPPIPRPQAPVMQRARLVRGEILHDNQGLMYEKTGNNIRPLHQLVSGPQGQVLELFLSAASDREFRYSPERAPHADIVEEKEQAARQHEAQTEDVTDLPPLTSPQSRGRDERGNPVTEPGTEKPLRAPYRKLFPDPGLQRLVRLGDFKAALTAQLLHPERLRDSHWIPCYLQVYEACMPQRLDSLAAAALGDQKLAWQFQFLTDAVARHLEVASALKPSWPMSPGMRRPGNILPTERVFRLQVECDPTADNFPARTDNRPGNPAAVRSTPLQAPAMPPGGALKKSIPERMIKPWEFRMSREEALYDMNVAKTFAGSLSSLARRLKALIGGGGETKKWRRPLTGKSVDEQLWAVRPPRGGVSHAAIREWARKTLEVAGYDSQAMLLEWEIFWRRKGV